VLVQAHAQVVLHGLRRILRHAHHCCRPRLVAVIVTVGEIRLHSGNGGCAVGRAQAVCIVLDEVTRRRLEKTATSTSGQVRAVLRAEIVLLAARGVPNAQIAAACGTSVNTVRKWRGRFAEHGLSALADARRPGRPRIYGPAARVEVVAMATSMPPYPESTWSHRRIAGRLAALGISSSQVGRILADLDIRPHRVRGWLTRREEPTFWTRAAEICGLYLAAPPGIMRLSLDEKTSIQARSRKHPGRPPRRADLPARTSNTSAMAPSRSSPPWTSTPARC